MPPPAPHPETSAILHSHLTPELQQAMEKWFTDRIKVSRGIETMFNERLLTWHHIKVCYFEASCCVLYVVSITFLLDFWMMFDMRCNFNLMCMSALMRSIICVNVNQEHDAIRLADKGGCSDCGRPMADKMADFALETQGQKHVKDVHCALANSTA